MKCMICGIQLIQYHHMQRYCKSAACRKEQIKYKRYARQYQKMYTKSGFGASLNIKNGGTLIGGKFISLSEIERIREILFVIGGDRKGFEFGDGI